MADQYDPAIATPGIHMVRMGYLTPFDRAYSLTVGDRRGGNKRSVKLTVAHHDLLSSLDPTTGDREFNAEELGVLGWLAREGFITLIKGDAELSDFRFVPVPRRQVDLVERLGEGYVLRIDEGETIVVSKFEHRFLLHLDGERTLGDVADIVKKEILSDPNGRSAVLQYEKVQGAKFDSFLTEEALSLIKSFAKSDAITFEPKD